jgi:hypothetical protein
LIILQVFLGILSIIGLIWANQRFVHNYQVGKEFARQWAIVRSYVTEGVSPYDPAISTKAAKLLGESSNSEGLIFTQPFYAIIIILPLAVITDLAIAKTVWLFILELCLIGLTILGIRFTQWRPGLWNWLLLVVYGLLGFPAFIALVEGDMVILVTIFLAASLVALRLGWDELAGIALAFATIMPEVILTIGIFILVWIISKRRLRFMVWFFFTIIVLTIIGLFFIPDWPLQYLRVLLNYNHPVLGWFSTFSIFTTRWPGVGRQLAWFFSVGIVVIQLIEWGLAMRKDYNWFIWTACLTITIGFWVGIPTRIENFYLLSIPIILILAIWDQRIPGKGHWLPIVGLISAIVGMWLLFLNKVFNGTIESLPNVFIITFPLLILVGLYWIRWWCVRPQRLGMDELRAYEALR